mmetsp:Transcript_4532/g.7503  ORF Transcript_4532/g.7503 Transcript_4532/m.7503 type:complete len:249 (-) Transcript_4532:35-781(-)
MATVGQLLLLLAVPSLSSLAAPRVGLAGRRAVSSSAVRMSSEPTAVRFSIYPKTTPAQSLKATIKRAVSGTGELGLHIQADEVSSLLTGTQSSVFEAMEAVLSRAAAFEGRPHVSMQCTFSTAAPSDVEVPARSADAAAWPDPPSRVACQFALYSLGGDVDAGLASAVAARASLSSCNVAELPLCTALDGDGGEVLATLRACFELARARSSAVAMTATLTCNKAAWKSPEQQAADAAELLVAAASSPN